MITCAPNFPQGKLYEGYKNKLYQRETVDGIDVIRVWSFITANEGFSKRVFDYLSFAFSAFIAGLFVRSDIILATSPQFFTTLTGFGLSLVKRRPWIFELRDLWPESIVAVGAAKNRAVIKFLESLELFLYRRATRVVAVTEAFKTNLVSRGIPETKIHVITNGVDLTRFSQQGKEAALLSELNLRGKFVVSYIGTHGMAHGLDFIVGAAAKVQDPDVHFLFIGDGAEKNSVVRKARELNLSNVTFLDPVPKEAVARYLSICDVALVPLRRSDTFKSVIPSKIFEAAALQKPILLGVDGQAREIVENYDAGVYFEPENEQDFLHKLQLIKEHPQLMEKAKNGCLALAKDYDRTTLAERMLDMIKPLVPAEKRELDEAR